MNEFDFTIDNMINDDVCKVEKSENEGRVANLPKDESKSAMDAKKQKREKRREPKKRARLSGIRPSPLGKKPSQLTVRRLARRAGAARIAKLTVEEAETLMLKFLKKIIANAVVYAEHSSTKTVTTEHVLYSLKRNGRTLFPAKK